MKLLRWIAGAGIALALVSPASAQSIPLPAHSGHLSIEQIILLSNALKALDPFHFASNVRHAIAIDIAATRPYVSGYTSIREANITQHSHGTSKVVEAEVAHFNADDRKVLSQVLDIDFIHIKYSDLQLDVNEIPPSVISGLLPILDD
jgi:hypothetical protein